MTTEVTPHAAELERFCSNTKDYIGRAVVDKERQTPPQNRFVTLQIDTSALPCWGTEPILKGDNIVGYVTSSGMGWRTGKMLAASWLGGTDVKIGEELYVQILLNTYKAIVMADPVYDPENEVLLG